MQLQHSCFPQLQHLILGPCWLEKEVLVGLQRLRNLEVLQLVLYHPLALPPMDVVACIEPREAIPSLLRSLPRLKTVIISYTYSRFSHVYSRAKTKHSTGATANLTNGFQQHKSDGTSTISADSSTAYRAALQLSRPVLLAPVPMLQLDTGEEYSDDDGNSTV
jgi:hypothetical protein